MRKIMTFVAMIVIAGTFGMGGPTQEKKGQTPVKDKPTKVEASQILCPVSGKPVNFLISMRTDDGPVFFCSSDCVEKYKNTTDKYADNTTKQRELLEQMPKVQVTCPTCGKPADEKVAYEHDAHKACFCCKMCLASYTENPDKYHSALANAYTYQTLCPVTGKAITPATFATLPDGGKIYCCGKDCGEKLLKEPLKYNESLIKQGVRVDWAKVKKETKEPEEKKGA